jgi:organic hydroperoxide reductase OsmC/OhrA
MIYQTKASKHDDINGYLYFTDNLPLPTKHPLGDGNGYNPEQLIASAWATCLNATIQSLLEAKRQNIDSKVDITVTLCKEEAGLGYYYFQVDAEAAIKGMNLTDAKEIVDQAHLRCPVSKLLAGAKTLTLKTVDY